MRIPRKISLPWGWEVVIKQLGDDTISKDFDFEVDGYWDVADRTIYLSKTLPLAKKVLILGHEMTHMMSDWHLDVSRRAAIHEQSQRARKRLKSKKSR
jgi:hypothetical protein